MVPTHVKRQKLNLYFEGFSLMNNDRSRAIDNNSGPNPATPLARGTRPTEYVPPREVQLGARLTF